MQSFCWFQLLRKLSSFASWKGICFLWLVFWSGGVEISLNYCWLGLVHHLRLHQSVCEEQSVVEVRWTLNGTWPNDFFPTSVPAACGSCLLRLSNRLACGVGEVRGGSIGWLDSDAINHIAWKKYFRGGLYGESSKFTIKCSEEKKLWFSLKSIATKPESRLLQQNYRLENTEISFHAQQMKNCKWQRKCGMAWRMNEAEPSMRFLAPVQFLLLASDHPLWNLFDQSWLSIVDGLTLLWSHFWSFLQKQSLLLTHNTCNFTVSQYLLLTAQCSRPHCSGALLSQYPLATSTLPGPNWHIVNRSRSRAILLLPLPPSLLPPAPHCSLFLCCPCQVLSLLTVRWLSHCWCWSFWSFSPSNLGTSCIANNDDVASRTCVKQSPAGSPSLPGLQDPPACWHSCTNLAGPSFLHSAISAARLCCIFSLLDPLMASGKCSGFLSDWHQSLLQQQFLFLFSCPS